MLTTPNISILDQRLRKQAISKIKHSFRVTNVLAMNTYAYTYKVHCTKAAMANLS